MPFCSPAGQQPFLRQSKVLLPLVVGLSEPPGKARVGRCTNGPPTLPSWWVHWNTSTDFIRSHVWKASSSSKAFSFHSIYLTVIPKRSL